MFLDELAQLDGGPVGRFEPAAVSSDELSSFQLGAGLTGTQLFGEITQRMGRLPCAIVSADRSPALAEACAALDIELLSKPVDRHRLGRFFDAVARGLLAAE